MANYNDDMKLDTIWKAFNYKSRGTDPVQFYEEPHSFAFDIASNEIYANSIPSTPPGTTTSLIKRWYTGSDGKIILTHDRYYNGRRVWVAKGTWSASYSSGSDGIDDIMKNFLSPKYGKDYVVIVYNQNGDVIPQLDDSSWTFDYKNGVLRFETDRVETGSTTGSSISIEVYQYIGLFVNEITGLVYEGRNGIDVDGDKIDINLANNSGLHFVTESGQQRVKINIGSGLSLSGGVLTADAQTINNLTDIPTRNHNDLQNIQGGTVGQFNHLTNAQVSALHSAVTIGTANGLSLSGQALSLGTASTSTTGALTSTDWNTFNNKEPAITTLPVSKGGTGQTSLTSAKIMVGNATSGVLTPTELHWDNSNKRLGINSTSPNDALEVSRSSGANAFHPVLRLVNRDNGVGASTGVLFKVRNTTSDDGHGAGIVYERTSSIWGIGKLHFIMQDTSTSDNATLSNKKLTLDYNGNVGIGTDSPNDALEVSRSSGTNAFHPVLRLVNRSYTTGAATGIMFKVRGTTGDEGFAAGIAFERSNSVWGIGKLHVIMQDAPTVDNATLSNKKVTVDASGDVGIGTDSPLAKLHNTGSLISEGNAEFGDNITNSGNNAYLFNVSTSNGSLSNTFDNRFLVGAGTNGAITLSHTASGTSLIGSTSTTLFIQNDNNDTSNWMIRTFAQGNLRFGVYSNGLVSANNGIVNTSGSSASPSYGFIGDSGTGLYRITTNTMGFATSGSERVRIDSSGNLLVGTTTAQQKLTVNGNVSATAYRFGNSFVFSPNGANTRVRSPSGGVELVTGTDIVLFATQSNNVGIGNVSPSFKLDVTGDIRVTSGVYRHGSNEGITGIRSFYDRDDQDHLVVISGGIITNWSIS